VQHPLVLAPDSSLINKICSSDPSKPREKLLFSLSSCSVESICGVCLVFDEFIEALGRRDYALSVFNPCNHFTAELENQFIFGFDGTTSFTSQRQSNEFYTSASCALSLER